MSFSVITPEDYDFNQSNINTIAHPEIAELDPASVTATKFTMFAIRNDKNMNIGMCCAYNLPGDTFVEQWIGIRITDITYWNKGYGTGVVSYLVKLLQDNNTMIVKLQVLQSNLRAIRCYEKCGFSKIDEKYINGMLFNIMHIVK